MYPTFHYTSNKLKFLMVFDVLLIGRHTLQRSFYLITLACAVMFNTWCICICTLPCDLAGKAIHTYIVTSGNVHLFVI